MGAEYEVKFRASAEDHAAVIAHYPGNWHTTKMQTTYYDTCKGSLCAKHYTLRRRLENGVSICTVKTPGTGFGRGEWEIAAHSITEAIPELCKLGGPADLPSLCKEGLLALCGAEFLRRTLLLELPGCTAELALDSGTLFGGTQQLPLCEIELELKEGSRTALDAFAAAFAARFHLLPENKSKFARAMALRKGESL